MKLIWMKFEVEIGNEIIQLPDPVPNGSDNAKGAEAEQFMIDFESGVDHRLGDEPLKRDASIGWICGWWRAEQELSGTDAGF